jgi:hypothetical protein
MRDAGFAPTPGADALERRVATKFLHISKRKSLNDLGEADILVLKSFPYHKGNRKSS